VLGFGNKNAHLGEIKKHLGIPVPDGFAVSTFAFQKFLEHNALFADVQKVLSEIRTRDIDFFSDALEDL